MGTTGDRSGSNLLGGHWNTTVVGMLPSGASACWNALSVELFPIRLPTGRSRSLFVRYIDGPGLLGEPEVVESDTGLPRYMTPASGLS